MRPSGPGKIESFLVRLYIQNEEIGRLPREGKSPLFCFWVLWLPLQAHLRTAIVKDREKWYNNKEYLK